MLTEIVNAIIEPLIDFFLLSHSRQSDNYNLFTPTPLVLHPLDDPRCFIPVHHWHHAVHEYKLEVTTLSLLY